MVFLPQALPDHTKISAMQEHIKAFEEEQKYGVSLVDVEESIRN